MYFPAQKQIEDSKLQVLLIDDVQSTGTLLSNIVNQSSYAQFLTQVPCGIAGIEIIKKHVPGLVIVDLHIPGKCGFEVLTWTKENHPQIKTVMISNSLKAEYKLISESLGADYFLDKQTELNKIAEIIKTIATSQNSDDMANKTASEFKNNSKPVD